MREQRFSGYGPAGPVRRQVQPVSRRHHPRQNLASRPIIPKTLAHDPSVAAQNFRPATTKSGMLIDKQKKHVRSSSFSWLKTINKPQVAILSAAVFIFLAGLSVSVMGFRTNVQVEAQAKKLSQQSQNSEDAGDHPDETDLGPGAVSSYKVDPTAPRRINIPKIGVNARIKPLGTKTNNELKAPTSIYDAGWFDQSARLGERGATLIDGHVHGLTKPGVFYNLKKLSAGDKIEIERGDGKLFKYQVIRSQTYSRHSTDMQAAVASIDPALPGLNIITCTGTLEKKSNTYSERLLVQAVLVD